MFLISNFFFHTEPGVGKKWWMCWVVFSVYYHIEVFKGVRFGAMFFVY
jgi:hypothetical protein